MRFNIAKILLPWGMIALLLFSGCATQTTTEQTAETTKAPTSLTTAEAKTYKDALARIEQGEAGKALSTLNKLSQAHPGQAGIWLNLAIANYQDGKLDESLKALAHAQQLNANIPAAHNLAGLIAVDKGDYAAAEKHYKTALGLDKNFADAHYNLALLYDIYYQDVSPAVEHYQQYLTLIQEEDKATSLWLEELRMTLKRRGEE